MISICTAPPHNSPNNQIQARSICTKWYNKTSSTPKTVVTVELWYSHSSSMIVPACAPLIMSRKIIWARVLSASRSCLSESRPKIIKSFLRRCRVSSRKVVRWRWKLRLRHSLWLIIFWNCLSRVDSPNISRKDLRQHLALWFNNHNPKWNPRRSSTTQAVPQAWSQVVTPHRRKQVKN